VPVATGDAVGDAIAVTTGVGVPAVVVRVGLALGTDVDVTGVLVAVRVTGVPVAVALTVADAPGVGVTVGDAPGVTVGVAGSLVPVGVTLTVTPGVPVAVAVGPVVGDGTGETPPGQKPDATRKRAPDDTPTAGCPALPITVWAPALDRPPPPGTTCHDSPKLADDWAVTTPARTTSPRPTPTAIATVWRRDRCARDPGDGGDVPCVFIASP
jgi:hypothetical protein